jgi:hypothetical protein
VGGTLAWGLGEQSGRDGPAVRAQRRGLDVWWSKGEAEVSGGSFVGAELVGRELG